MKRSLAYTLFLSLALCAQAQNVTPKIGRKPSSTWKAPGCNRCDQGLSPAQWNFKAAPDKWSIAEVTEHIAAAEDFLMGMVKEKVMTAPARPAGEDVASIDSMVTTTIPDRSHKAQAPEPLKPTNRFGSPEGSLKHFTESREATETFLKNTNDLRAHAVDSPLGKKLDGYEWILFVGAHSERHTKQILEVKADPNFPKS